MFSSDSKKVIHDIMRKQSNSYCADCSDSCALYVDMNNKIFLCSRCASIHKQLGFKVKNVAIDDFSQDEVDSLKNSDNQKFNSSWMALYNNNNSKKIPFGASVTEREDFLTDKYQKKWYSSQPLKSFNFDSKLFQTDEEYSDDQTPFASSSDQSDFSDISSPNEQPFFGTGFQPKEIELPAMQQTVNMADCYVDSESNDYDMDDFSPQKMPNCRPEFGQNQMFDIMDAQYEIFRRRPPMRVPQKLNAQKQTNTKSSAARIQQIYQKPQQRIMDHMNKQPARVQRQSQSRYNQDQILNSISNLGPQQPSSNKEMNAGEYLNVQQQPFIQNSFASNDKPAVNSNPFTSSNKVLNSNQNPFQNQVLNSYSNQPNLALNSNPNPFQNQNLISNPNPFQNQVLNSNSNPNQQNLALNSNPNPFQSQTLNSNSNPFQNQALNSKHKGNTSKNRNKL